MTHVFISYSRKDSDFVNRLEIDLHQRGIITWRDVHSIPGGAKWFRRIKQGLESSYAMIYVDTPDAETSDWVEKEFLFSVALNLPIIPIKYDACFISLATINLNPILCDTVNYSVGINKIIAELKSLPQTPIVAGAIAPPEPPRTAEPVEENALTLDYRQEALDYLQWLLVKTQADLRDALYVNLQAVPERALTPTRVSPLNFGLDVDFDMGFKRLDLERIRGEDFDKNGDDVPDARVPLGEMSRVILLGEPGAGKTTTLLQLAVDTARIAETNPDAKLPVFVPLREYDGSEPFPEFVQKHLYNLQDVYADLTHAGRLLFLLDALNEMPRQAADGRDLVAEVRDFLRDKQDWVVSCRVRDYQEELQTLGKIGKIRLKPLDPPRIYEVIQRRFREQFAPAGYATVEDGEQLWRAIAGGENLLKAWETFVACGRTDAFWGKNWPHDVKPADAEYVWDTLGYRDWGRMQRDKRRMLPLCRNPYMVKMVTDLYAIDKSLPNNRGALFKKFVDKLLERDRQLAERVGAAWLDEALIRAGLAQIAYAMGRETEIGRDKAEALLQEHFPDVDGALLLRLAQGASLLDVGEHVRFTHQLLQEYFASEVLGALVDAGTDPHTLWKPENWWEPNGREETLIILAGVRGDPEGVARWIAPAHPELGVQVLTDSGVAVDLANLDERTKQALIDGANSKTDEPNPIGRASAYRVLALLDADKRKGIGVIIQDGVQLPDIEWVTIPAGEFTYQNGKMTLDYDYQIARYPVTYAQFQTFLDDPEGFNDPDNRWFAGLAQPDKHKPMREQEFKYANHPREMVNWYQALAFCRWLSWRLGGGYDLEQVDQWAVRLPTEFEWEKAARGMTGWQYPYGDKFDALRGNTSETGIGQTSAVGIFPLGDALHWDKPVADLSGNVWEWCLTDYRNSQRHMKQDDLQTDVWRVLRGGAWSGLDNDARAVYRLSYDPGNRNFSFGFRFVARPFANR